MKSATEHLWFSTDQPRAYINITPYVTEVVENSDVQEGFVLVSAMHITAGVYVNDAEEGIIENRFHDSSQARARGCVTEGVMKPVLWTSRRCSSGWPPRARTITTTARGKRTPTRTSRACSSITR
jgi:hypothetical protein